MMMMTMKGRWFPFFLQQLATLLVAFSDSSHHHVAAFTTIHSATTTKDNNLHDGSHSNDDRPRHHSTTTGGVVGVVSSLYSSSQTPSWMTPPEEPPEIPLNVRVNEFFKQTVPPSIRQNVDVRLEDAAFVRTEFDTVSLLTAPPGSPGVPRPLWLVILGSVPTGLLWYGYYKFSVEEELFQMELDRGIEPQGFGGYGTLGPFVYFSLLGPLAQIFHVPGGLLWSNIGIIFIYYTQFLLYNRVNELYTDMGREAPLSVWWCLPIFFPFDLIVGLRQVHFLSQYHYATRFRGYMEGIPTDPVVELFPFIGKPTLTWPEFLLTPSLWFRFLAFVDPIDRSNFPEPVQEFLAWGEGKAMPQNKMASTSSSIASDSGEATTKQTNPTTIDIQPGGREWW